MNQWLDEMNESICVSLRENIVETVIELFFNLNEKTAWIGTELSKTPQSWNNGIFNMIKSISDNAVIPIAGMILTLILCYEIVSVLMEKNNMGEFETFIFFKIIMKMGIAVYILKHTFKICMSIFDIAQNLIQKALGVVEGNTEGALFADPKLFENLDAIDSIPKLVSIWITIGLMKIIILGIGVAIMIVLYGRFMEIYMYCSVAPIPFATFANREWGQIGTNYVRGLMALAFQGFFMLICVAIYNALVLGLMTSDDLVLAVFEMAGYSVLLVLSLFKTSQISKSIFNAH